jgi:hypothetical protein
MAAFLLHQNNCRALQQPAPRFLPIRKHRPLLHIQYLLRTALPKASNTTCRRVIVLRLLDPSDLCSIQVIASLALSDHPLSKTMAVKIETGGPMAKALEGIITPKLLEVGWSTDPQDNTLTEYIVLMLANGKSQDEVARELSGDLLGLPPDDHSTVEFSQWLFQQVDALNNEQHQNIQNIPTGPAADTEMGDVDGANRPMYVFYP